MKEFITPQIRVVILKESNIIATSNDTDNTPIGGDLPDGEEND